MLSDGISRRQGLRVASAALVGAGLSGCANLVPQSLGIALTPQPLTDPAVFNFALNLEYLEAEYYLRGVTGQGLARADIGPNPREVVGGRRVAFQTPEIRDFMEEIASDERAHVQFLRRAISNSPLVELSRPRIDLEASFRAAGQAAGLGPNFDPFADEDSFLLGAFIFEDVGVTAYNGGAKLIGRKDFLEAAAGILSVEAYHAGLIRAQLFMKGPEVVRAADAISAARERLDGSGMPTEEPPGATGRPVVAPADPEGLNFKRTPEQVLNVVFLTPRRGVHQGGFFPDGVQGVVRHT
ncbi:MAG: ferritin-like domain-containing protein [Proteobacteria bacterium]|nr:ferritin-like domain-containing protein [Pseudomonadota bacterium]